MSAKLEWKQFAGMEMYSGLSGAISVATVELTPRKTNAWTWRFYLRRDGAGLAPTLAEAQAAAESTFAAWLERAGLMVKP